MDIDNGDYEVVRIKNTLRLNWEIQELIRHPERWDSSTSLCALNTGQVDELRQAGHTVWLKPPYDEQYHGFVGDLFGWTVLHEGIALATPVVPTAAIAVTENEIPIRWMAAHILGLTELEVFDARREATPQHLLTLLTAWNQADLDQEIRIP